MKKEVKLPTLLWAAAVILCLLIGMGYYLTRPSYKIIESRPSLMMKEGKMVYRNPNGNGEDTLSKRKGRPSSEPAGVPIH